MNTKNWYTKRADLGGLAVKAIKGDGSTAYGVLDNYGGLRKGDGWPIRCLSKGSYEWGVDGQSDFVSVQLMIDPKDWEFEKYDNLEEQYPTVEYRAKINERYYLVEHWDKDNETITIVGTHNDKAKRYKVPWQLVSGLYKRTIDDGIYQDSVYGLWLVQDMKATLIAPKDKKASNQVRGYMGVAEGLGPMQLITRLGGNSNDE